jgi:hypothetical protein
MRVRSVGVHLWRWSGELGRGGRLGGTKLETSRWGVTCGLEGMSDGLIGCVWNFRDGEGVEVGMVWYGIV